jgi:hypothetical protein
MLDLKQFEKVHTAFTDYIEFNDNHNLTQTLQSRTGRKYLKVLQEEVKSKFGSKLDLWRGINGVLNDSLKIPANPRNVGSYEDTMSFFEKTDNYEPPSSGQILSATDNESVAYRFAIGAYHWVEDPKDFGVVHNFSASYEQILFHHDIVKNAPERFEEEREVTIIWS